MAKKYTHIKNPLTVIAIFATFVEIGGTVVLPFLGGEVQERYVWFLMAFPVFLVWQFFRVLWHKHEVLYAPKDYRDDNNFLSAKGITPASQASVIAKVIDEASQASDEILNDDSIDPEAQVTYGSDEIINGTVHEDAHEEEESNYEPKSEAKPRTSVERDHKSAAADSSAAWSAADAARTFTLKNYEALAAAAGLTVSGAGGIVAASGLANMIQTRAKVEEHVFKVLGEKDKTAFLRNVSVRGIPDHVFSGVSTRPDETVLVEIVSASHVVRNKKKIHELIEKVSNYYHDPSSPIGKNFQLVVVVVEDSNTLESVLAVKVLKDSILKYNVPVEIRQITMP
ncbi:hypothetical protein MNU23_30440 [Pseudomonas aeruginosa]|uniref:hypothetical protein n=1 Tax=Pseudomonas aeruginosa TaxID=287 RepID=UPI0021A95186|nr:hypothetical protein [Pseudomonas aeruginosa]MCT2416000.1 hypothetical protein [Pseudomonas aeruginosa]HBN8595655.1 hypothetical protein [Pseudomonas aeruginosa]HEJ3619850.1 hypothetical protein [Pseudomonas aeruginosa]